MKQKHHFWPLQGHKFTVETLLHLPFRQFLEKPSEKSLLTATGVRTWLVSEGI
jgi:hypothetical protein